jgi:phosphopantetheine--protein transferase-like protein
MILGIGTDIEDISRFRKVKRPFLEKILTTHELEKLPHPSQQKIAGIFSAKEAIIKACTPVEQIHFQNIMIQYKRGMPSVRLCGTKKLQSNSVMVSVSHSRHYAVAVAIVVRTLR